MSTHYGAAIAGMRERIDAFTLSLFPGWIDLVLFDCTTLFFESTCEDALRGHGYGKDGKAGEVQELLALAVTHSGLPPGFEIFPGGSREGYRSIPKLCTMHPVTAQVAIVPDADMFSKYHLDCLKADPASREERDAETIVRQEWLPPTHPCPFRHGSFARRLLTGSSGCRTIRRTAGVMSFPRGRALRRWSFTLPSDWQPDPFERANYRWQRNEV